MDNSGAIYEGGCVVSTLAGTGVRGFLDGAKDKAEFNWPTSVAVDKDGDIYTADYNYRLRKITTADGTVQTVAGTGRAGDKNGPAREAQFQYQRGIAIGSNGDVFIAEDSNRIRVFSPTSKTVRSIAVHGVGTSSVRGVATTANGSVLLCDFDNHRVVKIRAGGGSIETVAGNGEAGHADGKASQAQFRCPSWVAVSPNGDIYVADRDNHCLREIDARAGVVSTIAGTGAKGWRDGDASKAQFNGPIRLGVGSDGCVYVSDVGNNCIRKLDPAHGRVTTVAGTGVKGFCDGVGDEAHFARPGGLASGHDGVLYVADVGNNRIRAITLPRKREPEFPEGEFENVEEKPEEKAQEMNELTEKTHEATASTLPGETEPEFPERELEDIEKKLEQKTQLMNGLAQEIHEATASTLAARENLEKTKDATIEANRALAETQNALKIKRLELCAVWEQRKEELQTVEYEVTKMESTKAQRVAALASAKAELGKAQTVLDKVIAEKTQYAEELVRVEIHLERERARAKNAMERSTGIVVRVAADGLKEEKSKDLSDKRKSKTDQDENSREVARNIPDVASGVAAPVKNRAPTEGPQDETAVRTKRTTRRRGKGKGKGFRLPVAAYEEASGAAFGFYRDEQRGFPGGSQQHVCYGTGGTARCGTSDGGADAAAQETRRFQGA